jgi:hypothetical protein
VDVQHHALALAAAQAEGAGVTRQYRSRFGKAGKYNAQKTVYNGETYDSKLEAARAAELDLLLRSGEIDVWARGRHWVLAPACVKPDGKRDRAITYRPDFEVRRGEAFWCEDTKGRSTEGFRLRLRLWWRVYPDTPLWIVTGDGRRTRVPKLGA